MKNKLSCAAKELKKSKNLCQTLLNEREEYELEIQKVFKTNSSLKFELADMHQKCLDLTLERYSLH
ncbi:unnamed protein product [Leptidea sinapis]|uniref:Uncharacterized protein n=1 Tax=Leptidea sinapis TaxID=189913 RepID=A0A5E4PS22_9NEOP|nr:unnamed protein product [Leptidea sinapis]